MKDVAANREEMNEVTLCVCVCLELKIKAEGEVERFP